MFWQLSCIHQSYILYHKEQCKRRRKRCMMNNIVHMNSTIYMNSTVHVNSTVYMNSDIRMTELVAEIWEQVGDSNVKVWCNYFIYLYIFSTHLTISPNILHNFSYIFTHPICHFSFYFFYKQMLEGLQKITSSYTKTLPNSQFNISFV